LGHGTAPGGRHGTTPGAAACVSPQPRGLTGATAAPYRPSSQPRCTTPMVPKPRPRSRPGTPQAYIHGPLSAAQPAARPITRPGPSGRQRASWRVLAGVPSRERWRAARCKTSMASLNCRACPASSAWSAVAMPLRSPARHRVNASAAAGWIRRRGAAAPPTRGAPGPSPGTPTVRAPPGPTRSAARPRCPPPRPRRARPLG